MPGCTFTHTRTLTDINTHTHTQPQDAGSPWLTGYRLLALPSTLVSL